jgi:hypothetical protein
MILILGIIIGFITGILAGLIIAVIIIEWRTGIFSDMIF